MFDRKRGLGTVTKLLAAGLALLLATAAHAAQPAVTAFIHVNVVPMKDESVLTDQTVIVRGSTISDIGRDLPVPAGATVIDGRGKFLSPGLADMHTHSQSREDMKVYLANGVTTLLNLGGATSNFVGQRLPSLNRGELPGPHVYVALRIDGTPQYGQLVVQTPEQARWAVRLAKVNGYQFIKIYTNLTGPVFAAVADEAGKQGLGLAGHKVQAIPLQDELHPGNVLIAHLEELMYSLFTPPVDDPLAAPPDTLIAEAVALLKANQAFVVADLITFETMAEQWGKPGVVESYFARPEAKFVPVEWRLDWRRAGYVRKSGSLARRAEFEARLVKALSSAGVELVAGTDAPTIPGIVPGFSLHDNLDRLTKAGLTRFEALATATRTPGEFISKTIGDRPRFGQVVVGYRADLILTENNPLDDLRTLREPFGIMANGNWYAANNLDAMMKDVAATYDAAAMLGMQGRNPN